MARKLRVEVERGLTKWSREAMTAGTHDDHLKFLSLLAKQKKGHRLLLLCLLPDDELEFIY